MVRMSTLPRSTVVFSQPQWDWIKAEASRLGLSVNEVIRRIIDNARAA